MSTTAATAYKPTDNMVDLPDIVKGFDILDYRPGISRMDYPIPEDAIRMKIGDTFEVDFTEWVRQQSTIPTAERFIVSIPVAIGECEIDVLIGPLLAKWVNGKYIATYQLEEVEWA